jgi:hypothetical protein
MTERVVKKELREGERNANRQTGIKIVRDRLT